MTSLLEKYRCIEKLRLLRKAGDDNVDRQTLQQLASAFPGALRELELLPTDMLVTRIVELTQSEPTWAEPMWTYHRHLRRILEAKKSPGRSDLTARELAQLKSLPGRRVSQLAAQWTCAELGLDANQLRNLLWPLVP